MGVDDTGAIHHYHTPTETVHVIDPERGREHVADISGHERDTDWMAFVGQKRGWDRQYYFTTATDGRWF